MHLCFRLIINPRVSIVCPGLQGVVGTQHIVRQYLRIVRSSRELRRSLSAFAGICSEAQLTEAVYANPAQDDNTSADVREAWD